MTTVRVGLSPWQHLNPDCFPTKINCSAGVELDILESITTLANLTIIFIISNTTIGCGKTPLEYGSNGSWTGLFKMLQDGEIDMIGNLCNVNKLIPFNNDFFSVSWPVWQYEGQFVIQAPSQTLSYFLPNAPLNKFVWLAYLTIVLVYLCFLILYSYVRFGTVESFTDKLITAVTNLSDTCCGFMRNLPFQLIWPLWFILLTSLFIFYNTYILSAVLHPFPVWHPFSNCDEFIDQLLSKKYQLLSYKNPPAMPGCCVKESCRIKFANAIKENGIKLIPNGGGAEFLEAIADQDPQATMKYVLDQGTPYISLYFSEYLEKRDKLWLIEEGGMADVWSSYIYKKSFKFERLLNSNLIKISDYNSYALSRYVRPYGAQPYMTEQILKKGVHQAFSFGRFQSIFYMHFGGIVVASVVFLIEIGVKKYRKRHYMDIVF